MPKAKIDYYESGDSLQVQLNIPSETKNDNETKKHLSVSEK
jgi:hypothetical protein